MIDHISGASLRTGHWDWRTPAQRGTVDSVRRDTPVVGGGSTPRDADERKEPYRYPIYRKQKYEPVIRAIPAATVEDSRTDASRHATYRERERERGTCVTVPDLRTARSQEGDVRCEC